jgi:hypothetical protein
MLLTRSRFTFNTSDRKFNMNESNSLASDLREERLFWVEKILIETLV